MRRIPVVVVTLLALMLYVQRHRTVHYGTGARHSHERERQSDRQGGNQRGQYRVRFRPTVVAQSDGNYNMNLQPGTYNFIVAAPGYEPKQQTVTVLIGQKLDLDLRLSATAVLTEQITVVGNQAVETKTSESGDERDAEADAESCRRTIATSSTSRSSRRASPCRTTRSARSSRATRRSPSARTSSSTV